MEGHRRVATRQGGGAGTRGVAADEARAVPRRQVGPARVTPVRSAGDG